MDYNTFLESKIKKVVDSGFEVQEKDLNNLLFPFQKFCVKTALKKGKLQSQKNIIWLLNI